MAQPVKYFLCKHEEPSSIPSVHVKVIQGNMHFELQILGQDNPRAGEAASPAAEFTHPMLNDKPCLRTKVKNTQL